MLYDCVAKRARKSNSPEIATVYFGRKIALAVYLNDASICKTTTAFLPRYDVQL